MKKRKGHVLFIIHDNYQEDNIFPLGAGYLAAVLRARGVKVSVYCMDVFHYTGEQLAEYLSGHEFDLIAVGFMVPRFKRTVEGLCKVINACKKNAWLVLGGHGPTPIPEYILKTTKADVAIIGEAEETLFETLQCKLNSPGSIAGIKGLAYRIGAEIVVNQRRGPVMNLDSLPFPEWELFPMDRYTTCLKFADMKDEDRAFPVITSRGCVNKCSFCHRMEEGVRIRRPENILQEMKLLNKKYKINYFYFADELSVVSKKQVLAFAKMLKNQLPGIMFRMDCRVDVFDDDIAKSLKDAGCVFLNIGFESLEQQVLNLMNKNVTVEQNIRAAQIANKYGIGIGLNLIWGLPGDNEKTLRKNAEFIKKYNLYDQIRTIRPVTPYPGSPLYREAIDRGFLKGPADFFEKFKNADLYMINFMDLPEKDIYEMLFEVNKDLILDHYNHTTKDMIAANSLIEKFYALYFKGKITFTGPRHLDNNVEVRSV